MDRSHIVCVALEHVLQAGEWQINFACEVVEGCDSGVKIYWVWVRTNRKNMILIFVKGLYVEKYIRRTDRIWGFFFSFLHHSGRFHDFPINDDEICWIMCSYFERFDLPCKRIHEMFVFTSLLVYKACKSFFFSFAALIIFNCFWS